MSEEISKQNDSVYTFRGSKRKIVGDIINCIIGCVVIYVMFSYIQSMVYLFEFMDLDFEIVYKIAEILTYNNICLILAIIAVVAYYVMSIIKNINTKLVISKCKLVVKTGFLFLNEDEFSLLEVKSVTSKTATGVIQRMTGYGNKLVMYTNDKKYKFTSIENPDEVRGLIFDSKFEAKN